MIRSNMASYSHIVVLVGILGLAHAALSAAQHRTYLRLTEQEFTRLPADIVVECLISLIVTCYGAINIAGQYKEIRAMADFERKSMDTVGNRPSFYMFHHRGRKLFSSIDEIPSPSLLSQTKHKDVNEYGPEELEE